MHKFSLLPLLCLLPIVYSAPSITSTSSLAAASKPSPASSSTSLNVADLIPRDYNVASSYPWQQQQKAGKRQQEAITSSAEDPYSNQAPSADSLYGQVQEEKSDAFVMKPAVQEKVEEKPFLLPPSQSVVPKMTGSLLKSPEEWNGAGNDKKDHFGGPITNPAAYYMEGANLEDIKPPKCQMIGCDGPFPNDYDFSIQQPEDSTSTSTGGSLRQNKACHTTFVPLNSCVDNRGYPLGMLCQICCDCTQDLASELKKSRGYIQGYKA